MTPGELAYFKKQSEAQKPAPAPAPPAPRPAPAPPTPAPDPMLEGVDPSLTGYVSALQAKPQNKEGQKYRAALASATQAQLAQPAQHTPMKGSVPGISIGDVLDWSPEEAEAAGFTDAAQLIRKTQGTFRMGGPTNGTGTPFSSEWGQQAMKRLRTVPLQRSTGEFGMHVPGAEHRLAELYFMKSAKERGLTLPDMTEEQRNGLMAEALDQARRQTASIMEVHEQQGNVMAPLDTNKMIMDTYEGKNLPALAYAAVPALAALAHLPRGTGPELKDNYVYNLMAPFIAAARPGVVSDSSEGKPLSVRETKMGWMFRLAPSTALASWILDPDATWELGGQRGFGGIQHVAKIVRGYDITREIPRIAEAYDKVTPWESGYWEKTLAAGIPIAAVIFMEPDAISVGTGLLAAPLAKGAKEIGLGAKLMKYAYKPAIEAWEADLAAGKTLAEISSTVPTGSVKRAMFNVWSGSAVNGIAREAAEKVGDDGARLGDVADLDQIAAKNAPELAASTGKKLEGVQDELQSAAHDYYSKSAAVRDQIADAKVKAQVAAADAIAEYRTLENAAVGAAVMRGGQEALTDGDRVIDRATGQIYDVTGYRASKQQTAVAAKASQTIESITETRKGLAELEAEKASLDAQLKKLVSSKANPANRTAERQTAIEGLRARVTDKAAEIESAKAGVAKLPGAKKMADLAVAQRKMEEPGVKVMVRPVGEAVAEGVEGADAASKMISIDRLDRMGNPAKWPDIKAVITETQQLKKQYARWEAVARAAEAAGDEPKFAQAMEKLGALKGALVKNLTDASFEAVETAYHASRAKMISAVQLAERLSASTAHHTPEVQKALAEVEAAYGRVKGLISRETALERQKAALEGANRIAAEQLQKIKAGLNGYLDAIDKGLTTQQQFRNSVIKSMISGAKGTLDGPAYRAKLVERYGAEALDQVMNSPTGAPIGKWLDTQRTVGAKGLQKIREFESAVHSAAESRRMSAFAPAQMAMKTLSEQKIPFEMSREYVYARGYQLAQTMARASDWVGGTAIGRAPKVVREALRRSFERFAMLENDLGVVGKRGGVATIREFLTSTKQVEGAFGNRDVVPPAEKALAYLRAIAKGDLWDSDPVVEALSGAQLASGTAARVTPLQAKNMLKAFVEKETATGAGLIDEAERVLGGFYSSMIGKTDQPDVVFRFIARALAFGSSQHDTMYDLLRATGGGIDAEAARALNWLTAPERQVFAAHDLEKGFSAAQAYNTPKLIKQRGALAHVFKAHDTETKILKLAEVEGGGVYIPHAMWEAMKEVPRDLAKEMKEFHTSPTYAGSVLNRMSRLWRVSVVNGYVVPRAAYFVNNFVSDIFQIGTSHGFGEAARQAIQIAPAYVPFVGPRLQDKLFEAAERGSVLSALFDPTIKRVLEARTGDVIMLPEGATSAAEVMRQARLAGCFDSMSTRDLMEITRRTQKGWDPLMVPHHIELSARFMETIQSRNRLGLWLRRRMTGATEEEARDALQEALYDWKTGIPTWEHNSVGKAAMFWSYRRNTVRQLGAALTEGISNPDVQFGWKALTGQTKLGRTVKVGRALNSAPDMLYWTDPNAMLDDEAQLHEFGMRSAPWWVTAQMVLGNREISKARKLWYSEVAGRDVTFESLMLPAITTLDQLYMMNLFMQTGAASLVGLAEKAGLSPNMTVVDGNELAEKNIRFFTDMLAPGLDEFMDNALRANLMGEGPEVSSKGIPIPKAQAVFLRRLGLEEFMAASPDPDGQIRVDSKMYGLITQLVLSLPPVSDLTKNWLIFADNPGYQESFTTGVLEALQGWTGLARPQGFNPTSQLDYASSEAERREKEALSTARKHVTPKAELQHR